MIFHPDSPWNSEVIALRAEILNLTQSPGRAWIVYSTTAASKMAADLRAEGKINVQVESSNMASGQYWTVRWTEPKL